MKLCYLALLLGLVVLTLSDFADASPRKNLQTNQLAKKTKERFKPKHNPRKQAHPEKRKKLHPSVKPNSKKKPKIKPSPSKASTHKPNHNPHNHQNERHHNATSFERTRANSVLLSYSTAKPIFKIENQPNSKTPSSRASTFNHNLNHTHHNHHNDTTIAHTRANPMQSSYHLPSGPIVQPQPQRPVPQTPTPQAPPPDSRKKSGTGSLAKVFVETVVKAGVEALKEHGKPKPTSASKGSDVRIVAQAELPQKHVVTGVLLPAPVQQQPGNGSGCMPTNVTVDLTDKSNPKKNITVQQIICYTIQQPQPQPAQPAVLLAPMNPLPENKTPTSHKSSEIQTSGSKSRLYSTSMLFSALMTFLVAFCMH